ncbi:MAG: hypothetical protein J6U26_06925 [Lachnospiraceae bacterium]|nr:hypothetical protein [Lachnospiraceae bacterium]
MECMRMKHYLGLQNHVTAMMQCYFTALFPEYFGTLPDAPPREEPGGETVCCASGLLELPECCIEKIARDAYDGLYRNMVKVLSYVIADEGERCGKASILMNRIPALKCRIDEDVRAAYEGDPAAAETDEVILTYPAFRAISTYRLAHEFYVLGVPVIPRMMSEQAHSVTGIDIHPGASIGHSFFIDHGTGVVIGETTTIGDHVKLYQHVTLGAKSFAVAEDGTLVKGIKRHPDIGNNVVIYAGATILGGNTVIGDGAVIGGNTWITSSVAPGETVTNRMPGRA